ncbi:MAG: hypothetical protein WAK20_12835 [Candidatus Acidiferrum sp.]
MSLFLAYFDPVRAVVCSDNRAILYDEAGTLQTMAGSVPKFSVIGDQIIAVVGRSDVSRRVQDGFARLLADFPATPILDVANALRVFATKAFGERTPREHDVEQLDVLELAAIGWDADEQRIRCWTLASVDKFQLYEMTGTPDARVFALGYYNPTDRLRLEQLSDEMTIATLRRPAWIAAALRSAANDLHDKYPDYIGSASYFAALEKNAIVELPREFPAVPETELPPLRPWRD